MKLPNVTFGSAFVTVPVIVSASGAPPLAATLIVYVQSAGPSCPSGTVRIFSTGKLAVVGLTLYVLVNVSGASVVELAVAVSVPLPLSTTVTVTVFPAASASLVTPATVPVSDTV